jgi:hypothetical protein
MSDPNIHDLLDTEAGRRQPEHQPAFEVLVRAGRRRAWRHRAVGAVAVLAVAGGVTAGLALPGTQRGVPAGPERSPALVVVTGELAMVGGPPGITESPRPIPGTIIFMTIDGERTFAQVASDGRFTAGLAPGQYTVVGYSPNYNRSLGQCRMAYPALVVYQDPVDIFVACQVR